MNTKNDIVVIDRFDYDELVEKANLNDQKIEVKAKEVVIRRDTIPVRIEFDQYRNRKNFSVPVSFSRGLNDKEIWDALDVIEPKIQEWMDVNMEIYNERLKERDITEKNCISLSKHVSNLQDKIKGYRLKNIFLWGYSIIVTAIILMILAYAGNLQI